MEDSEDDTTPWKSRQKRVLSAREMAQCFCVYSDLLEDLSLVCSTHVRWVTMSCDPALGFSVLSSSLHVYLHTCSSTCT